jgi:tryptophanyl-tRNA synthetase
MRTLTGITPSGVLHIGNYFGAMRPAIEAQASGDCYYFIADYHSMTSVFDAAERRPTRAAMAIDWLACGLDPKKSVFWRQSDVPEVCELTGFSAASPRWGSSSAPTATRTRSPRASRRISAFSPTRSSWPPTSCSSTRTLVPSARTRSSTWR